MKRPKVSVNSRYATVNSEKMHSGGNSKRPPSDYYLGIQNKLSHYHHILTVKPNISLEVPQQPTPASRLSGKYVELAERERLYANTKLISRLEEIRLSRGAMQESFYKNNNYKPQTQRSIHRSYNEQLVERQRQKNNSLHLKKLKNTKPEIGNVEQWRQQYTQSRQQARKLSRVSQDQSSMENRFYNTFSSISKSQKAFKHKPQYKQKLTPLKIKELLKTNRNIKPLEEELLMKHPNNNSNKIKRKSSQSINLEFIKETNINNNKIPIRKPRVSQKRNRIVGTATTDEKVREIKRKEFKQQFMSDFI